MAVPAKKDARKDDVIDLTSNMDASGTLTWVAPAGKWTVFRIGHACTMAFPHPVPEELIGKTLIAITNLPPRPMMGLESCGMLLSATHQEDGEEKLHLIMVDPHIPAGAKLC
jgi:hypothetical protein